MESDSKLLLVGIDGLLFHRAMASGRAKTLSALHANSFFCDTVVDLPTVSGPSWTTFLTGMRQEVHNVSGNDFKDHRLENAPDFLTRAVTINPELITYAAAGWPPLIDPQDVGPVIRDGHHIRFARDGETHGYLLVDEEVFDNAHATLKNIGPNGSFVYFCGVDEAGHLFGSIDSPYYDAVERIDGYLFELVQVVTQRLEHHKEQWLIVVVTDHGHRDEGGHGGDSEQERASFILAHGIGRENPQWPHELKPHELADYLLAEFNSPSI